MKWVKDAIGYWCSDIREKKYLGQNIGVAILDSGIAASHPDFYGRIAGFEDFVNGKKIIYDDSGHGTHVAGILSGTGKLSNGAYAGLAPGASLFIGKVLDQSGNGMVEYVMQGIRWILDLRKKRNVRIVNISVGTQPGLKKAEERRLLDGVDALWDAGLVVVVSAGNYGPGEGTVAVPGSSKKVITVGVADTLGISGRQNRAKWDYSGQGPTECCVVKPDVVAPGTSIVSCNGNYKKYMQKPYVAKSGTSMATPMVSGAIACLLSKYPDMTNVEVKLKLRESCVPAEGTHGWGMLHVERLLSP